MAVLKDLIVHGNSRFLNASYFNQLKTDKIGAEEGIFNKIVATTGDIGSLTVDDLTAGKATVLSLLDVRGELHTNQWTNSNIATIDGSFYITPTIGVPSGTMTTTANSVVINGSNFPINSLYVNEVNSDNTATTVAWTSGSKVLVTGEILVNGVYMPLGTLIGTLSANATASQIQVGSITDNRYQTAESLAEIGTQSTALPCRNVKVSLYQTSRSSTLYPLGIFMTALGENGKTFLDIYGGGYATSTATAGGFAKPVLRIGNLAGLPAVGGSTPTGYGIYTSNGYFSGAIVAKKGKIGDGTAAWTIGNDSNNRAYIYSGITNITTSGSTAGTYVGTNGISNYNSTTQYVNLTNGVLTAQGAVIKGALTATSLATGNPARTSSGTGTAGTYIASDGAIYVGSNNSFTVTAAGAITAKSGTIGGWNISASALCSDTTYSPAEGRILLAPGGVTISSAVGNLPVETYAITAGTDFGVTTNGQLYASGAVISGDFNVVTGSGDIYNIDDTLQETKAVLETKISQVENNEGTDLISNINAVADRITLSASQINFTDNVTGEMSSLSSAISIDTTNESIRVGASNDSYIMLTPDKLGFWQDGNEVAYISNNQLFIGQSVVLQQMDLGQIYDGITGFGQWSWKIHKNGQNPSKNNLNLKWIG